jgi:hypothetical protein
MPSLLVLLPVSCWLLVQVPVGDNYYAALNSAVFSDGSFVYVPKGVKSPMELSTYFRINASETGQVGSGAGAAAAWLVAMMCPQAAQAEAAGVQHEVLCGLGSINCEFRDVALLEKGSK